MPVAAGWRLGLGSADVCFLPGEGFPFCSLTELLLCLNLCVATNSLLATLTTSLGLCYCAHRQIKASLDLKLEVFFVLFCFSFVCSSGPFWEENGKNNKIRSDGAISGHTWLGISEMLGAPRLTYPVTRPPSFWKHGGFRMRNCCLFIPFPQTQA